MKKALKAFEDEVSMQMLEILFPNDMEAKEISDRLNRSGQDVYLMSLIILNGFKMLRQTIINGAEFTDAEEYYRWREERGEYWW